MILTNENVNKLINKFIDLKGYRTRKDILGVFFYGSALYGYNTKDSDIDLHIITNSSEDIRGNLILDNTHIEYFERPYDKIIEQVQYEKNTNQTVILSMLGYGKIVFEKDFALTNLQNYIKDVYNGYSPKPLITKNKAIFAGFKIYISIGRLEKLIETNDELFMYMYFIVLDSIKQLYERFVGLSTDISQYKLKRFYLENEKQINTFKTIPDKIFIQLFLTCLNTKDKLQMLKSIKKLFNYCSEKLDCDFSKSNIVIPRG